MTICSCVWYGGKSWHLNVMRMVGLKVVHSTRSLACLLLLVGLGYSAQAQGVDGALPDAPSAQVTAPGAPGMQAGSGEEITVRRVPINVLKDQGPIWTSPFRLRAHDLVWVAPLALATGAAIATDHRTLRDIVSHDSALNNACTNTSNILIGGFIAAPVVFYGVGHYGGNEHARETGLLSAQALLDGLVVEQGMKLVFWRERPYQDAGRGRFFQS